MQKRSLTFFISALLIATFLLPQTSVAQKLDLFGDLSHLSQKEKSEVRDNFVYGKSRWEKGDYETAAKHFTKVYDLTDLPVFIYHSARCYEELKQYRKAIRTYEKYIFLVPGAKTESDAQWRIDQITARIEEDKKQKNFVESTTEERDDKKALKSLLLGLTVGGMGVVLTPIDTTKVHIPVDILAQFNFTQWFMLTTSIGFSPYAQSGADMTLGFPVEKQFSLGVGFAFGAPINSFFTLYAKFQFNPTWLSRYANSEPVTWLCFQGAVGGFIHIAKGWSIIVEAVAGGGPAFVKTLEEIPAGQENNPPPWTQKRYDYADVGGRIGVAYTFEFTKI